MPSKFAKIKQSIWRTKLKIFSIEAKLLGIFLMTNEFCVMVGVYHIPKINMALSTGLSEKQVDKALAELIEGEFCCFDEDSSFIWVKDMAKTQVADNPNEKQRKGVLNEITRLANDDECPFVDPFLKHYSKLFKLPEDKHSLEYDVEY